jgi:hypothetical protein
MSVLSDVSRAREAMQLSHAAPAGAAPVAA